MTAVQPAIKLMLKKQEYQLVFDFQAISDAEEVAGRSLLTGLRRKDLDAPTIKLVQAMLYASLKKHHPAMTYELAGSFLTPKNLAVVWGKVIESWMQGMSEKDDEDDDDAGEPQGQN